MINILANLDTVNVARATDDKNPIQVQQHRKRNEVF
jgi:hypothetical protein